MSKEPDAAQAATIERLPDKTAARQPWEFGEGSLKLGTAITLLLWDYPRTSLAYDLALLLIALVILLVPGSFWSDPLWRG